MIQRLLPGRRALVELVRKNHLLTPGYRRAARTCRTAAILAAWLLFAPRLHAGGGPENVALVINARSWASQTVAQHYAAWRQIPPCNLVYLDWPASNERTDVQTFRRAIIEPVLRVLAARGLAGQIEYLVYSTDLPWAVDCTEDARGQQLPPQLAPVGSITGLTALWPLVATGRLDYLRLDANQYYRRPWDLPEERPAGAQSAGAVAAQQPPTVPTHGFGSWYGWGPEPRPREAGGQFHLLSTMLGVTAGRGNSVREVLRYLSRAAAADGTCPRGTIYFVRNADVRSKTRDAAFASVVQALEAEGVRAAVVGGVMPEGKADVQGVQMGIADFDWTAAHSQILPGAICEHLTSFGGVLNEGASQTPLTEFLRHGAAGACGTVVEPYAIAAKFPHPAIHLHYARGCTLAEAFYQSVSGPYQLLIVGDPLCRPWARIPQVRVCGLQPGAVLRGSVSFRPEVEAGGPPADRFLWFIDGLLVAQHAAGETFSLDTERLADGYHELRVVAIERSDIETQGRLIGPVIVSNHAREVQLDLEPEERVGRGEEVIVRIRAPGAAQVGLLHTLPGLPPFVAGEEAVVTLDTRRLGLGPCTLQAGAVYASEAGRIVRSPPRQVVIEPPPAIQSLREGEGSPKPGLLLLWGESGRAVIERADERPWLAECGVPPGTTYVLQGEFNAAEDGWWQLQVRHSAGVQIEVSGQRVYEAAAGDAVSYQYVPLFLAPGRHRLRVMGQTDENARLELRLGAAGLRVAASTWVEHRE